MNDQKYVFTSALEGIHEYLPVAGLNVPLVAFVVLERGSESCVSRAAGVVFRLPPPELLRIIAVKLCDLCVGKIPFPDS